MSIYKELGVKPFINACAPHTRFGGSIMPEPVMDAMAEASRQSVNIYELQKAVGEAIARLTNNEAAYVSCGAASGITLAVAACIAGMDESKSDRLPNTNGMKNEVIMHRCERGTEADTAIRNTGASIVAIGGDHGATEEELRAAISDKTAAVLRLAWDEQSHLANKRLLAVAHERGVPVLVDGADSVPPKSNLMRYTRDACADALIVSGGKGIRGPQTTGLILGTRAIVDGCVHHGAPNCRIGRGMKVGKEEMVGIYAAVKLLTTRDETEVESAREKQIDFIRGHLSALPHLTVNKVRSWRLEIMWDQQKLGLSFRNVQERLLQSDTPVLVAVPGADRCVAINAGTLLPGQEQIVAKRLEQLLKR